MSLAIEDLIDPDAIELIEAGAVDVIGHNS
jgi:hypothetical protein